MKSKKYCGTRKSIAKLKRQNLIDKIRHYRDNWEKLTKRSMDQDDEYLKTLTVKELKNIMEFYTSDECKSNIDAWIPKEEHKIKTRKTRKIVKTPKVKREKKCQKQTLKKYITRKSPPYPANECKEDIKIGNDGLYYKSQPNKNGIYRWVKYQGL